MPGFPGEEGNSQGEKHVGSLTFFRERAVGGGTRPQAEFQKPTTKRMATEPEEAKMRVFREGPVANCADINDIKKKGQKDVPRIGNQTSQVILTKAFQGSSEKGKQPGVVQKQKGNHEARVQAVGVDKASIQEVRFKGEAGIEAGAGMGSRCRGRVFLFQMGGT